MNKWIAIGCVVVVVLVVALGSCSSYNGLVSKSQAADAKWAEVQSAYQRRADLIPNLVATVKGAANFEQSTLEAVTNARASVGKVTMPSTAPTDPAKLQAYQAAQGQLSSSLSRLLLVAENYPTLTATENYRELQAQLEGTENRINFARDQFNEAVRAYNVGVHSFPSGMFASWFGFKEKPFFAAEAGAATVPTVKF